MGNQRKQSPWHCSAVQHTLAPDSFITHVHRHTQMLLYNCGEATQRGIWEPICQRGVHHYCDELGDERRMAVGRPPGGLTIKHLGC